jgi:Coenzyme PQQ synthesis protein D (PqqD)
MAARFRTSPDALATRVGDEIVLVHTVTDQIYVLNRTGARVWELLCDELDRTEIESRLADEFDVAHADLAAEVGGLIAALVESRLITELGDG